MAALRRQAEAGRSLWVPEQSALCSVFQNSQDYTEKPCLEKNQRTNSTSPTLPRNRSPLARILSLVLFRVHYEIVPGPHLHELLPKGLREPPRRWWAHPHLVAPERFRWHFFLRQLCYVTHTEHYLYCLCQAWLMAWTVWQSVLLDEVPAFPHCRLRFSSTFGCLFLCVCVLCFGYFFILLIFIELYIFLCSPPCLSPPPFNPPPRSPCSQFSQRSCLFLLSTSHVD